MKIISYKCFLPSSSIKPDKAIIDCPSPNIKRYKEYLLRLLENKKIELIEGIEIKGRDKSEQQEIDEFNT